MKTLAMRILAAALLTLPAASAADSFREEFDQPGGAVTSSRFSVVLGSTNLGIVREPLSAGQGAPSTGGVLPVDEGGDSELRFFEAVEPAGSGYVLTPEQSFADVDVDGYLGVGFTDDFGVRDLTFVLRATGSSISTLDAYSARFIHTGDGSGRVSIALIVDGIGQLALVRSDTFPVDSAAENYRLIFRAEGDLLTAELWRVESVDGQRVETPVDLETATPEVENAISVADSTYTAGAVGFRAFIRSTNSVFLDDVEVTDLVFDDGFESGDTAGWSATLP